jgi:hypothetical protein
MNLNRRTFLKLLGIAPVAVAVPTPPSAQVQTLTANEQVLADNLEWLCNRRPLPPLPIGRPISTPLYDDDDEGEYQLDTSKVIYREIGQDRVSIKVREPGMYIINANVSDPLSAPHMVHIEVDGRKWMSQLAAVGSIFPEAIAMVEKTIVAYTHPIYLSTDIILNAWRVK